MRAKIIAALILATVLPAVHADEKFAVIQAGGVTYSNVTVTTVTATDIFFTYDGGMANVKLKNLPPDLQQHFHYDPQKAGEAELKLRTNESQYYQNLIHQPAVHPPDMTRIPATGIVWHDAFTDAWSLAAADKKLVLLQFTGSDWSSSCIKFDQEVLSTAKFADYAQAKLELVRMDYPNNVPQSDELKQLNQAVKQKFNVVGFPTFILLDANGKELGRQIGYLAGGPEAFIAELDGWSNKH